LSLWVIHWLLQKPSSFTFKLKLIKSPRHNRTDGENYGGEFYVSSSVSRNNLLISSLFVHAKIQTYAEPSVGYRNNYMYINVMKTTVNFVRNSALRSAMPHTEKLISCLYSPMSFGIPYRFFVDFQNSFYTHTYIHVYIQV